MARYMQRHTLERSSIRTVNAIERSLRAASGWLGSTQSRSGAWSDFWTPSGMSDEWVTAYVGAALATATYPPSRAHAHAAWHYLAASQRREGGWGYSAAVPCDADSTAWALILQQRLDQGDTNSVRQGLHFISTARVAGGISTYPDNPNIRRYVSAVPARDFSGWTNPHACVTAVAAQLTALQPVLLGDVLAAQQPDGSWQSYWWFEDAYATAMSVTALAGAQNPRAKAALKRAGEWASRRLDREPEPSSFALSLLLLTLAQADNTNAATLRCANVLRARQERDGRWRGSARLRIPAPDRRNPSSVTDWKRWWGTGNRVNIFSLDQCSFFTTASAFLALQLLLSVTNRDEDR